MMREALIRLLKLKSLITLMVVGALTAGFLTGLVSVEVFSPVSMAIITYYFRKENGE